jgi:hypothetical protein
MRLSVPFGSLLTTPTVLHPVDAGGDQRDGAGVDDMNDATKTPS